MTFFVLNDNYTHYYYIYKILMCFNMDTCIIKNTKAKDICKFTSHYATSHDYKKKT